MPSTPTRTRASSIPPARRGHRRALDCDASGALGQRAGDAGGRRTHPRHGRRRRRSGRGRRPGPLVPKRSGPILKCLFIKIYDARAGAGVLPCARATPRYRGPARTPAIARTQCDVRNTADRDPSGVGNRDARTREQRGSVLQNWIPQFEPGPFAPYETQKRCKMDLHRPRNGPLRSL